MAHHRTRKHHRKHQKGGRSDEASQNAVPSSGVDDEMKEVPGGEIVPPSQSGGRRRGGRRRGGRRSSRSSDGGSRKGGRSKGGRRSRKGGFIAELGSMLHEALVPIGLSLYTIKKSRRNRVKRGGDDIA